MLPTSEFRESDDDSGPDRFDNDRLLRQLPNGALSMTSQDNITHRGSKSWIHSKKCMAESLDFDEMESVVWRKVQ